MVNQSPPKLKLNKANTSDTEALFLDLHLFISNSFVSSKINDTRDDFGIVIFPFFEGGGEWGHGDVPRSPSYGVYILVSFEKIICHKRIGYKLNVMPQSACVVINQIKVDKFAALFYSTQVKLNQTQQ